MRKSPHAVWICFSIRDIFRTSSTYLHATAVKTVNVVVGEEDREEDEVAGLEIILLSF